MICHRQILTTLVIALCLMALPDLAYAHGAADFSGLVKYVVGIGFGILNGLVFLAVIVFRKKYTIWSISRLVLFALLFFLSEVIVLGVMGIVCEEMGLETDTIFDGIIYSVLYPAVYLAAMAGFKKDTQRKPVWKINGIVSILLSVLLLIWFIAEEGYLAFF